ncbi:hypothetical protein [Chryseobacterium sp.]|uniref:hypothetical protein n=1 Tax=Chryseobacterium sp. TaxID=1871047 RepID=UPI00321A2974
MEINKLTNGNIVDIDGKSYKVEVQPPSKEDRDQRISRVMLVELPKLQNITLTSTVIK